MIWSLGDQRGKGFLLGATAGRTTLTGEGLQHCDGQSLHYALAVPELPRVRPGVRVRGRRARARRHPAHVRRPSPRTASTTSRSTTRTTCSRRCPTASRRESCAACTATARAPGERTHRAQILASGPMVLHALEAQAMLAEHHDVAADVWSVPGWKQLRDDALDVRALEPPAPGGAAAHAVRDRAARATPRARSSRSPTG